MALVSVPVFPPAEWSESIMVFLPYTGRVVWMNELGSTFGTVTD